jgi:hypothetical protein
LKGIRKKRKDLRIKRIIIKRIKTNLKLIKIEIKRRDKIKRIRIIEEKRIRIIEIIIIRIIIIINRR